METNQAILNQELEAFYRKILTPAAQAKRTSPIDKRMTWDYQPRILAHLSLKPSSRVHPLLPAVDAMYMIAAVIAQSSENHESIDQQDIDFGLAHGLHAVRMAINGAIEWRKYRQKRIKTRDGQSAGVSHFVFGDLEEGQAGLEYNLHFNG